MTPLNQCGLYWLAKEVLLERLVSQLIVSVLAVGRLTHFNYFKINEVE